MTPERWQQVDEIFQAAIELNPAERAPFLDTSCLGDEELRREVVSLITSDEQGLSFIDAPAYEVAASLLLSETPELHEGQHIGHYQIVSMLGAGGMGEVYLAQDTTLGRQIALKLLPSEFTGNPERLRRFQQEARAASALNHPNIITIHEIGHVDSRHFIATEFVDGETLRQRMRRGPLSLPESLDIAIQVCGALAAAHRAGIVHRDIKPENIMLRPDAYVKVLDFGLAKLTEQQEPPTAPGAAEKVDVSPGLVMGTVKYMSPEQAQGLHVDQRSDIFSLGAVIYEMIAGRAPFVGESNRELIASVLRDEPLSLNPHSPDIPSELRRILDKTLRKNRDERYQTTEDLLVDLKSLRQELELGAKQKDRAHMSLNDREALEIIGYQDRTTGKRNAWLFASVLVLVSLCVGILFVLASRKGEKVAAGRKSIAVLPFKSIGTDEGDEYLRLGITDALITKLSGLRQIIVRPLASVTKYSGKDQDPIAAGRELGVDVVLEGRIQKIGDRYRVTVQLWQVSDGVSLSSYKCDEQCASIFDLQESISERVTNALAARLTPQEQQYLAKRYTENKEVYDLYLKGRFYWSKKTLESYKKSVEFFNQAIGLDENYAPAYAGLSDAYVQLAWAEASTSSELMEKGKTAATKALELDDNLAEVHTSVAYVKFFYDWDWPGAEREFERAIALKPNYATALNYYSYALANVGQSDKAISTVKAALELDPLSVTANFDLGAIYLYTGHSDEAIAQLRKVIEMDPDMPVAHHFLLNAYYQKGMHDEFIEELLRVRANSTLDRGDWSSTGLAPVRIREVYATSGWKGFLEHELDTTLKRSKSAYVSPKRIAALYAMIGNNDKAMEWLEKTYQEHSKMIMTIKVDPRLEGLRSDPRFKELLGRVGLPQ